MEGCSGTCGRQGTAVFDADQQVHLQLGRPLTWADHSSEAMSCAARSAAAM